MEPLSPEELSAELERLAEEQVRDRASEDEDRAIRNRQRRERVVSLYARGALRSGQDFFYAALIFLYGDEVAHFDLARTFAKHATTLGEMRAWFVIAAAWDRALLARGKPQRFGTQFIREHGRLTLGRVDPRINDYQRAMYGVPPLWYQQQNVEQLQRREEEF
jgi:hypothetical protein